ncbi:MAG TPA: sugar transferase [Rhodothermales bacterium]|nr:sugar transferase [Rhodothermales bacterium]
MRPERAPFGRKMHPDAKHIDHPADPSIDRWSEHVSGDGSVSEALRPGVEGKLLLSTLDPDEIRSVPIGETEEIVCEPRLNNVKHLNRYLAGIQTRLVVGGLFRGNVETSEQRRRRLLNKYPVWYSWLYYPLDFVFKRAFPKLKLTRWLYQALTKGRNRVFSETEVLGRLIYCGFDVVTVRERDNLLHFTARKRGEAPKSEELDRGIILKLERIGRYGLPIIVYKFRTMHPYAPYLQEFVYERNKLDSNGKFRSDFRITAWGRWLRRTWIDELPMIVNFAKGDLKLVGVRPLTPHYLGLYPPHILALRLQAKPGLIPPYYADMPANFDEIVASEARYLEAYNRSPLKTDLAYLGRVLINIILRGARSM